jgi:hypothetical protein
VYDLCATSEPLPLFSYVHLRLCCSFRHMSHHRSFPLRQDGGAPATSTKPPTRMYVVQPPHSLSSGPHLYNPPSLCLYHLTIHPHPSPTPSPLPHPTSTIGQPEAADAMWPDTFVCNMALLLFTLVMSAATMALEVNGPGCKSGIRYLVGPVPLTDLQLLSLIATRLSPT